MKTLRCLLFGLSETRSDRLLAAIRTTGFAPDILRLVSGFDIPADTNPQAPAILFTDASTPAEEILEARTHLQKTWPHLACVDLSKSSDPIREQLLLAAGVQTGVPDDDPGRLHAAIDRALPSETLSKPTRPEHEIPPWTGPDPVTGLPNRSRFVELVRKAVHGCQEKGISVGLLLLDLDRFKEVNDTLGHDSGDMLLEQVGQRLRQALPEPDVIARIGGDEFGILLPRLTNPDEVQTVVETVHASLDAPFLINAISIVVETSIGVATFPEHADTANRLLQHADIALYRAKEIRMTNSCVIYRTEFNLHSPERLGLLSELKDAIAKNELLLHYQPKLDLLTGRITGFEALVRWQHPRLGVILPDRFILASEQTGLIGPLTRWVMANALEHARKASPDGPHLPVSVNLSGRLLQDPDLPEMIDDILRSTGSRPEHLMLEITESAISPDTQRAGENLQALAERGVALSIDDFGTGYTSFMSLKNHPVQEIKIDKSFVIRMLTEKKDAMIVRTIIEFAHNFGLSVVAEGVESQEVMDHLSAIGCDMVQGYFISPPRAAEPPEGWLSAASRLALEREADRPSLRIPEPAGIFEPYRVLKEMLQETSALSGEPFFREAARVLSRLFDADFVFVARLKETAAEEVEVLASFRNGEDRGSWSFRLSGSPCAMVYAGQKNAEWANIRTGHAVYVDDQVYRRFESTRDTRYEAFVGVPLFDPEQRLTGHIALFFEKPWPSTLQRNHVVELVELFSFKVQSELNRDFSEKERQKARQELEAANRKLLLETLTDPLTGLQNRRHFSQCMQEAFEAFRNHHKPFALLLLDVDHFKSINDTLGHDAGDIALRHVARRLQANCRSEAERVFRVGGEEFAILCQGQLSPETLQRLGDRINRAFRHPPEELPLERDVTVSIGGAFPLAQDTSWNATYTRADRALYQAKNGGRDRTVLSSILPSENTGK